MMLLEELHLVSFKGFRDFHLNCLPFTCLIGPNNGGKTSILEAIRLLHEFIVFVFGRNEKPDFNNIRWNDNPLSTIKRLHQNDPDAIWLDKQTTEPAKINAIFSNQIVVSLNIEGQSKYNLDISVNGVSIKNDLNDETKIIVENLYTLSPIYVPPPSAISPSEVFTHYANYKEQSDTGHFANTWRQSMYWHYNDGDKSYFDKVVSLVQRYIPNVVILPPRLTHDLHPRVLIEYNEGKTSFDIGASGGGLRTLLNIASVLCLSPAQLFLFDEPDSHLHPNLQSAVARLLRDFSIDESKQVFVATHAPDFISEIPTSEICWIDRQEKSARYSTKLGTLLSDLGSLTKADAVRAYGFDKILFVEGNLDKTIFREILKNYLGSALEEHNLLICNLPSGKGDLKHLVVFKKLVMDVMRLDIRIVSIVDMDYELKNSEQNDDNDDIRILKLDRKEIENYLIEPKVIEEALKIVSDNNEQFSKRDVTLPTINKIEQTINGFLSDVNIRNQMKYKLIYKFRDRLSPDLDKSTKEQKSDEWFNQQCNDFKWCLHHCPGKEVLKKIREKYQKEFGLTLTQPSLISALLNNSNDFVNIVKIVANHLELTPIQESNSE